MDDPPDYRIEVGLGRAGWRDWPCLCWFASLTYVQRVERLRHNPTVRARLTALGGGLAELALIAAGALVKRAMT